MYSHTGTQVYAHIKMHGDISLVFLPLEHVINKLGDKEAQTIMYNVGKLFTYY